MWEAGDPQIPIPPEPPREPADARNRMPLGLIVSGVGLVLVGAVGAVLWVGAKASPRSAHASAPAGDVSRVTTEQTADDIVAVTKKLGVTSPTTTAARLPEPLRPPESPNRAPVPAKLLTPKKRIISLDGHSGAASPGVPVADGPVKWERSSPQAAQGFSQYGGAARADGRVRINEPALDSAHPGEPLRGSFILQNLGPEDVKGGGQPRYVIDVYDGGAPVCRCRGGWPAALRAGDSVRINWDTRVNVLDPRQRPLPFALPGTGNYRVRLELSINGDRVVDVWEAAFAVR